MVTTASEIARRVADVRARIARAALRGGRKPEEVTLVAVGKTQPPALIRLAYEAGVKHVGENRVQDPMATYAEFQPPALTLHLIGHLQRNKARKAAQLFDVVHSLDSTALAESLSAACAERRAPLPVLIEVNVAGEESKEGVAPAEVAGLLARVLALPHLLPRGLMTVAPLVADAEEVRPVFRRLRELRDECERELNVSLPELSMGMTNDFEVAVEEGATLVRVGRAIFGERM
jgi:pyridoxal phosphate enzyme (YggS family)